MSEISREREAYLAAQQARIEKELEIVRILDATTHDGWNLLREFAEARDAESRAWADMGHEDRMTVLTAEKARRDELLASISQRES